MAAGEQQPEKIVLDRVVIVRSSGGALDGGKGRGVYKASESLRSVSEGVRIAVRGGKRVVADGPFAESKEMVGGFFLLDCRTREQAIAIAGECPATEWGTVEVREVGPCYEG